MFQQQGNGGVPACIGDQRDFFSGRSWCTATVAQRLMLVTLNRSLGQDFQWGLMIKNILALKAKFLDVSPFRHLELTAPKLPVNADSVDYYMVSKCVF